jgi:hypothetical protein
MDKRKNPYAEVLIEIEKGLWGHDCRVDEGTAEPYFYDDATFRACLKVFMSGMLWKAWVHMEGKEQKQKEIGAKMMGEAIRDMVFEYTGIDTRELHG